jgi:hypothetical protein
MYKGPSFSSRADFSVHLWRMLAPYLATAQITLGAACLLSGGGGEHWCSACGSQSTRAYPCAGQGGGDGRGRCAHGLLRNATRKADCDPEGDGRTAAQAVHGEVRAIGGKRAVQEAEKRFTPGKWLAFVRHARQVHAGMTSIWCSL